MSILRHADQADQADFFIRQIFREGMYHLQDKTICKIGEICMSILR